MAWRADTDVNWKPARRSLRVPLLALGIGAMAALAAYAALDSRGTGAIDPPATAADDPAPRKPDRSSPDAHRYSTAPRQAPGPRQAALPRRAPAPRGELRSASR